jgi:hypothetical protein
MGENWPNLVTLKKTNKKDFNGFDKNLPLIINGTQLFKVKLKGSYFSKIYGPANECSIRWRL